MRKLVVAALLVVLSVAGCGSDDSTTDATDTTEADTAASEAPVTLSGKVNDEGTKDAAGAADLDLAVADFSFAPTFIKTTAGQKLTIALKNEGKAPHTFTSTELKVDEELQPGATTSVEITVPSADAVLFFCRFHQGGGMQGAVFTKEGATAGSSSTGTTAVPAGNGYQGGAGRTTAADGASPAWNSGDLAATMSHSHVFNSPGSFAYHCARHPSMTGTVTVG